MKAQAPLAAPFVWLLLSTFNPQSSALAQGTAFTYQGRLNSTGQPANGTYDLQFAIYDSASAGNVIAGPVTNSATAVSNGLFTVVLDFGAGVFTGPARFLEIDVRTNGAASFAALSPRQPITAAPYSVTASHLTGVVSSSSLSGTYSSPVSLLNLGNVFAGALFSGTFDGDGSGLTSLNASQLASGTVPDARLPGSLARTNQVWLLNGNAGTSPANTNFLGTTDFQPLELRVAGARGLRIEPETSINGTSVNVIGGSFSSIEQPNSFGNVIAGGDIGNVIHANSDANFIGGGVLNAIGPNVLDVVIAGGFQNTVTISQGVIGGGALNLISGRYGVISGGKNNAIGPDGSQSVIGGGIGNTNNEFDSVIGGGEANTIQILADHSVIGGGQSNSITGSQGPVYNAIVGGSRNTMQTNTSYSFIGAGYANLIQSNAYAGTIAGGYANVIQSNAIYATVAGGIGNTIVGGSGSSTIGGGDSNSSGPGAVVGGGQQNFALGASSTVGGGLLNGAFGINATIPGGWENTASGDYSFAAGSMAAAQHKGAFVWSDTSASGLGSFSSTANNQFLVRATGGVGINTNNPSGAALNVAGTVVATAFQGDGSGLLNIMTASNLSGVVSSANFSGTYTNAVTLNNASNNFNGSFSGSFSGNGGGLTNVAAATVGGLTAANFWQTTGNSGTIPGTNFLGTTDNQPFELWVDQLRALRLEPGTNSISAIGAPNVIGGAPNNFVDGGVVGATIAGGGALNMTGYLAGPSSNHVSAIFGTIGGGRLNTVGADHGFIGGGIANTVQPLAYDAVISGGNGNTIETNAYDSVIGGGKGNVIQHDLFFATISGGQGNTIGVGDNDTTIAGGLFNAVQANSGYSFLGGGSGNSIQQFATYSVLGGGVGNTIQTSASTSVIGGGQDNSVAGYAAAIGGGYSNSVASYYAAIGGGQGNNIQSDASFAFIGAGNGNNISPGSGYSFIGGGIANTIQTNSGYCVVGGGYFNSIGPNAYYAALGGGYGNTASGQLATIGGGYQNSASVYGSTVGGGLQNSANAYSATVGGGFNNHATGNGETVSGGASNNTSGEGSTAAGGENNSALAPFATVSGGSSNTVSLTGNYATIPGGYSNSAAGPLSFAAGNQAQANDAGAFVWADSQNAPFGSTGANQFLIRAAGGVGINTSNPGGAALNVAGAVKATAFQGDGSGLFNVSSGALGNYVFGYYSGAQAVVARNVFQDAILNSDAQLNGWTHTPGASQYTNAQAGIYLIHYDAEVTTTSGNGTNATLLATVNSTEIAGSRAILTLSALNQFVPVSRSFLASFNALDVLTLQFTGSGSGIRLSGSPAISLTITRIQ